MHQTVHYATGVIFACLATLITPLNFWTFAFIVACPVIIDFDIMLCIYAKDSNHRNLITHSIYPVLLLVLIGLFTNKIWILFGGFAYLSHILLDLVDWGLNLFYTGKTYGIRILLSQEEKENFHSTLEKAGNEIYFFLNRYYHSKFIRFFEITVLGAMIFLLFSIFPNMWVFFLGYIGVAIFHGVQYYSSWKSHNGEIIENKFLRFLLIQNSNQPGKQKTNK